MAWNGLQGACTTGVRMKSTNYMTQICITTEGQGTKLCRFYLRIRPACRIALQKRTYSGLARNWNSVTWDKAVLCIRRYSVFPNEQEGREHGQYLRIKAPHLFRDA